MTNPHKKMPDENGNWHCSMCNEFLPPENFGKSKTSSNGLKSSCRKCIREDRRNSRAIAFEDLMNRQAPVIAFMEFLDDNPELLAEMIHKYRFQHEPCLNKVRDRISNEYYNRSTGRDMGGTFSPIQKFKRINRDGKFGTKV